MIIFVNLARYFQVVSIFLSPKSFILGVQTFVQDAFQLRTDLRKWSHVFLDHLNRLSVT